MDNGAHSFTEGSEPIKLTDDELIAKFMGYKRIGPNGIGRFDVGLGYPSHTLSALSFATSWDWLMPVVDKIKTSGYDSTIIICALPNERDKMIIHTTTDIISEHSGDSLIESVYKAVVEFIKWFESLKSDSK